MRLAVKTSALLLAALLGLVDSQRFLSIRPQRNFGENSDEIIFPGPTSFPRISVTFPQPSLSVQRFLNQNANGQIAQAARQPNTQQFGNSQGVTIIRQPSNFKLIENDHTGPVIQQPNRQQHSGSGQGFAGTQQPNRNQQIGNNQIPLPQHLNPQFGNGQIAAGIQNIQGFTGTQQPSRNQPFGSDQGFTGTQQPSRNQPFGSDQGFTGTQQPSRNQPFGSDQGFTSTQQPSRNQPFGSDQGFTGTQQPSRNQLFGSDQGFTSTQQPSRNQPFGSDQGFTGTQQPSRNQPFGSDQGFTGTQQPSRPTPAENDRVTPGSRPVGQDLIPDQSGGSPGRRHHLCGVQPSPGECRGSFPRYYYNPKTDQCDCFVYGGCGQEGLESSYKTLRECHRTCLPNNLQEGPTCNIVFRDEQTVFHQKRPSIHPNPNLFPDRLTADQFLKQII